MGDATACPPAEDLRRFLLGRLEEAEGERVAGHLARCPACVAAAETLDARDELIEAVGGAARPGRAGSEADEGLIARLCHLAWLSAPAAPPPERGDTVSSPGAP